MGRLLLWTTLLLVAAGAVVSLVAPEQARRWHDELVALAATATPQKASGSPKAQSKGPGQPAVVVASQPVVREIVEWDEYTARVEAVASVDIRARVSGYLNEVHFKDGQDVQEGDKLFTIDPRPFERALDQARAELEQAKTKAENAKLDVDRGKPLVERRVISEKVFDDRANVLRDAQAAIRVSEAKVRTAELDLSFTRVVAPISGRIGRALVTPGNYVTGGGTANTNSTALTSIVSQDPVHVYFDVNDNNFLKYKRLAEQGQRAGAGAQGAPVYAALADEKGFPHAGRLDFLDNRLDQSTATIRARGIFDNTSRVLSPGMFARVRLAGSARYTAIMLPDEAFATDQASKYVWVVGEDGMPSRRNVTLGPMQEGLRIVREGVRETDWVVIKGQQRVRPGQKVAPRKEPIKVSAAGDGPPIATKP